MDYVQPYIGMLESCLNLEPGFIDLENLSFLEDSSYVYFLGSCFCSKDVDNIKKFASSRLWFTYRKNFPAIGGTGPSSDQGWGCMLRCGQMLLAQALTTLHLGRTWHWERGCKDQVYRKLLRMFQDKRQSLYSIHQIGQMGVAEGKPLGEWFGPNTIAQVLKKLVVYDDFSKLAVHVALDNILISGDVKVMATTTPPVVVSNRENDANPEKSEAVWSPLLIIVPLRLGLTAINKCYLPAIQEYFKLPQCAGIIGGRPNHAVYFFGNAAEKMIYLDPHVCQETINLDPDDPASAIEIVEDPHASCDIISDSDDSPSTSTNKKMEESGDDSLTNIQTQSSEDSYALSSTSLASSTSEPRSPDDDFDDSSFHCPYILNMDFASLDPSLALAFICLCEEDYNDLIERLKPVLSSSSPPLFEVLETRPKGWPKFVPYPTDGNLNDTLKDFDDFGDPQFDSDDNFEILE